MNADALSEMTTQMVELVRVSPTWLSMLVLCFASAVEYVFPPFPGDTILVAGGFFAARGAIGFASTFFALVAGTVLGSVIGWSIGRFARQNKTAKRFVDWLIKPGYLVRLEDLYRRRGNLILVLNRFLPGVRGAFMIGAGLAGLSLARVVLWGGVSALVWNAMLIGVGYWFSSSLESLLEFFQTYTTWAFAVLIGALLLWFAWRFVKKRKPPAQG